jgi:Domain of unknown function (DUF4159)/Saccharopine dehydrogenase NADP binding domain
MTKSSSSKYVVLGGGGAMGRAVARDLYESSAEAHILVADLNLEAVRATARSLGQGADQGGRVEACQVDVRDAAAMAGLLKGRDVVINASNYYWNVQVMRAAPEAGTHYSRVAMNPRTSARWMRFAFAFALALGLAVTSGAAQQHILTNGRNLQIPINHGLPDKPLGFTFCRLRYENVRRARKSGWGDDYPQADYNFMVRLAELTRTTISQWNDGYPGFANVTAMDPNLFRCPYLRMQNAANYEFTPEETARMHDYLLKGGFLWIDDNWDPDFEYIRPNLMRILPGARIVDLPGDHPMFSIVYRVDPLPQIPSLGSWQRTRQDSEIGPSTVHYYGVFDDHDRLVVLVSMNSDVSDSWEREGDNRDYFETYSAKGYALGVNVAVWVMTH